MLHSDEPHYRAKVATGIHSTLDGFIECMAVSDEQDSKCPCLFYQEEGMQCEHVIAMLHKAGLPVADKWWFSQRFHVQTYLKSYGGDIPALAPAGSSRKPFASTEMSRPAMSKAGSVRPADDNPYAIKAFVLIQIGPLQFEYGVT